MCNKWSLESHIKQRTVHWRKQKPIGKNIMQRGIEDCHNAGTQRLQIKARKKLVHACSSQAMDNFWELDFATLIMPFYFGGVFFFVHLKGTIAFSPASRLLINSLLNTFKERAWFHLPRFVLIKETKMRACLLPSSPVSLYSTSIWLNLLPLHVLTTQWEWLPED